MPAVSTVSMPVTLDDLSSGYNIDWNISQDPQFNYMLGFSENDVREMFLYYKGAGKLRPDADIEAMLAEMKPWYNNYCFAEECMDACIIAIWCFITCAIR